MGKLLSNTLKLLVKLQLKEHISNQLKLLLKEFALKEFALKDHLLQELLQEAFHNLHSAKYIKQLDKLRDPTEIPQEMDGEILLKEQVKETLPIKVH